MKVFITGISGFVGANLARYLLEKGRTVSGLVRDLNSVWRLEEIKEKLTLYQGDLFEKETVERAIFDAKPDIFYHSAMYGGYYHQKDEDRIFAIGTHCALNLLKIAKQAKVQLFVNLGSSSEYGMKDHPMREDEIIIPNSYYAISKAAQSHLVSYFSQSEKLPAVTLRLFNVYGPFEEEYRFIPTLIRNALANKAMPLTSKDRTARDFIYVGDVCEACERCALLRSCFGDVINVGTGIQRTLREAFNEVKSITGSSMTAEIGGYENREFDTSRWIADTSLAKRILGFEAKTNFSEGIKNTIRWFEKRLTWSHESGFQLARKGG